MYPHEINVFSKCIIYSFHPLCLYVHLLQIHCPSGNTGFNPRVVEVLVFLGCYAWPLLFEKLVALQILLQHSNWTEKNRNGIIASAPKLKAFQSINRSKLKLFKRFLTLQSRRFSSYGITLLQTGFLREHQLIFVSIVPPMLHNQM
jgi:hypothetical protein